MTKRVRPYRTANSDLAVRPGTRVTKAVARASGARMNESNSLLVFDIWQMINLQQMLAKMVPVRRKTHRGSLSRMSFLLANTQMKQSTQATVVATRGLLPLRMFCSCLCLLY